MAEPPRLPLVSERVLSKGSAGRGYPYHRLRKKNKNTYTDEEKARAAVIAAVVGDRKAAELLPIPRETMRDWMHGRGMNENAKRMAKHYAEQMAEAFEKANYEIVSSIDAETIRSAGLKDRAIASGIFTDKGQLLRGLPTQIEGQTMTREQRAARIAEMLGLPEPAIDAEFKDLDADDQAE